MSLLLDCLKKNHFVRKKRGKQKLPCSRRLLATWLASYGCSHRLPGHLTRKLHSNRYLQLSRITE